LLPRTKRVEHIIAEHGRNVICQSRNDPDQLDAEAVVVGGRDDAWRAA